MPLTADGTVRLAAWSAQHVGGKLGVFLNGKLVVAPEIKSQIGGGIPLRVASRTEAANVLKALQNGGISD